MSTRRITLRRKVAVAGATLIALALPLQAGAAHAATPEDELSACTTTAVVTLETSIASGTDYDVSAAIDNCVNTFLQEMGADQPTASSDAVTDGSVDTGILGTVDGVVDPGTSGDVATA